MRVYIISPAHYASGGTELLCQFSKSLSDSGIENYMVYVNADGVHSPVPEVFQKYHVRCAGSYVDASDAVMVVPETYVHMVQEIECIKGTVMVWWLSVDNYFVAYDSILKEGNLDVWHLNEMKNVVHFVQSRYAGEFLRRQLGIEESYLLMDYINDEIMERAARYQDLNYERQNICLFNPSKGYENVRPVIEACRGDIRWMPLWGYTPQEMADLMCVSKVYIDFGNHPGKDRIPREAAACGCCVVTNRIGSAAFQEDVDIPEYYKIADMGNIEEVLEVIYELVDHFEDRQKDFACYRERIAQEKAEFQRDIQHCIAILEKRVERQRSCNREPQVCRICGTEGNFDTYYAHKKMGEYRFRFPYYVCSECQCLQLEMTSDDFEKYLGNEADSIQMPKEQDVQFGSSITHSEKVLDVGCGSGDWLFRMAESGWDHLYGCNPFLDRDYQYGSRVTIRACSVHEIEGEGVFDWIHIGDSFGRMGEPLAVLRSVWRLLKPGGLLKMAIPVYPNIAFERFGTAWYQLDALRHIFLYSRKSLEWLSRKSGMAISGIQYDSDNNEFVRSFFCGQKVPLAQQTSEEAWRYFGAENMKKLQREAEMWNQKEYGDHMEVTWQKSTVQAVEAGKKVIFQRFSSGSGRRYPYPPLYREPDTDYLCFTDDERVRSSVWEIHVTANPKTADLEFILGQYAVRWELQQEQIQVGSMAEGFTPATVMEVPRLEELPLVKWEPEKLTPTSDGKGNYIYRKNPVYTEGRYNGRPLLLTIGVPVSNQIETIDRCLFHIRPLLEQLDAELLVIDTGSTDGTVEVCRKYNARIVSKPWCGNMSAVRNEGIYNAQGEWYLSIDDDEWFENVDEILEFFQEGFYREYDAATYIQRNYGDSTGTIYDDHHTQRMARITPGLHFEGRIHDALLTEAGDARVCVLRSYAHHYGFASDNQEKSRQKFQRNTVLLLQDAYEYPEDLRYLFQLAQEYAGIENETAVRLFLKTIAMAKEQNSFLQGKNSVVHLVNRLYDMDDQRLLQWADKLLLLFPFTAAEKAYIAWCLESQAFFADRPPEEILRYYERYEEGWKEYRDNAASNQYLAGYGLMAVEQETYIMDAEAIAFCAYLEADAEKEALDLLPRISMEVITERRIAVLAAGLAAGDAVYRALCEKIAPFQWEEWSGEIGNAFAAGLQRDSVHERMLKRLPDIFSKMSVPAVASWFEHAGERRGGLVGNRLLGYAMECGLNDCPVQVLSLCAEITREAYVGIGKETESAKEILHRYLSLLAAFAERYYEEKLLLDEYCRAIPAEVRAAYRMAAVLTDGKASHENVELLKQALAVFPVFHAEIKEILAGLKL